LGGTTGLGRWHVHIALARDLSGPVGAPKGETMITALPASMMLLGFAVGVLFGRKYRVRSLIFIIGACVLAFAYCVWVPKTGEGFEDMRYAIVALLIAMPVAVGTAGGWILGWRLAAAEARRARAQ
jgi:hypothetical protein